MKNRKQIQELIPWYLNGTLTGAELEQVEDYCTNDPEGQAALEEWMRVRNFMQNRDDKMPSASVADRLFDRIRSHSIIQLGILHPYAVGLSIGILILLWIILRPGIVLQWNQGGGATSFRIFRSEMDGSDFDILDEIQGYPEISEYSYLDLFVLPGVTYAYYVEGITETGSQGITQVIVTDTTQALPGQIAIIFASFCMGYGILFVIRYRRVLLIGNTHTAAK